MLGDLLEHYLKESLDRQLVDRLPFAFYLSLLVYILLQWQDPKYAFGNDSFILTGVFLVLFVGTSYRFGRRISKVLADGLFKSDFKSFISKIRGIYEGKDSLLGDLDAIANWKALVVAFLCGVSITGFMSAMFLYVLVYFHPGAELLVIMVMLSSVYIFYEVARAPLVEKDRDEKQTGPADVFEAYTVTNSLTRLPFRSKSLLYLASKFIAPIAHIDVPKFNFENSLVYENAELYAELERMEKCEGETKVCLKHEEGMSLTEFRVDDRPSTEKITILNEKSPKEAIPYLMDPDYKFDPKEKRRWSGFSIQDRTDNAVIARLFMHKLRAVTVKRRIKATGKLKQDESERNAIQFYVIGERSYVQYFKIRVESLSVKVPSDLVNYEYDPRPGPN